MNPCPLVVLVASANQERFGEVSTAVDLGRLQRGLMHRELPSAASQGCVPNWDTPAGQLLAGRLRFPLGPGSALLLHICRSGYTQKGQQDLYPLDERALRWRQGGRRRGGKGSFGAQVATGGLVAQAPLEMPVSKGFDGHAPQKRKRPRRNATGVGSMSVRGSRPRFCPLV